MSRQMKSSKQFDYKIMQGWQGYYFEARSLKEPTEGAPPKGWERKINHYWKTALDCAVYIDVLVEQDNWEGDIEQEYPADEDIKAYKEKVEAQLEAEAQLPGQG